MTSAACAEAAPIAAQQIKIKLNRRAIIGSFSLVCFRREKWKSNASLWSDSSRVGSVNSSHEAVLATRADRLMLGDGVVHMGFLRCVVLAKIELYGPNSRV